MIARVVAETDKFRCVKTTREMPTGVPETPTKSVVRLTLERRSQDAAGAAKWDPICVYEDGEPAEPSRALFAIIQTLLDRVDELTVKS